MQNDYQINFYLSFETLVQHYSSVQQKTCYMVQISLTSYLHYSACHYSVVQFTTIIVTMLDVRPFLFFHVRYAYGIPPLKDEFEVELWLAKVTLAISKK